MGTGEKLRPRESIEESLKTRTTKHSSTEHPEVITVTPAPRRPSSLHSWLQAPGMLAFNSLRESHPQHAVPTSALLFLSSWLLRKMCLFFYFLCPYFPQQPKQTLSKAATHQSQNQKKRKRKKTKTSRHTRGTGTQELDFWEKRKQLCIPVFLPSSPTPIFHPHPTPRKPEGFFSPGVLPEGQGH